MSKKQKNLKHLYSLEPMSDDTFAFIAGRTPAGIPYGTTWEERKYRAKRDTFTAKQEQRLGLLGTPSRGKEHAVTGSGTVDRAAPAW